MGIGRARPILDDETAGPERLGILLRQQCGAMMSVPAAGRGADHDPHRFRRPGLGPGWRRTRGTANKDASSVRCMGIPPGFHDPDSRAAGMQCDNVFRVFPRNCQVIIAGGGPFGLMLAIELGAGAASPRPCSTRSFENRPQIRRRMRPRPAPMEHYRRLGIPPMKWRALGMPPDFSDRHWPTSRDFARHEIGAFSACPRRRARRGESSTRLSGILGAPPANCRIAATRCSSNRLLRRSCPKQCPGVSVNYGWAA